jgi:riboflavin kinase/FMN adenylyltransferase
METIFLKEPPNTPQDNGKEKVIALGYFDGLHIGHQKVIQTAVDQAREKGMQAAVMTFHPHPSMVLKKLKKRDNYLTPPEEKADVLAGLGVDLVYFVTFDDAFSQLSPQDFIDQYLIKLHAKHIVAGFDFTFGKMAKGDMSNIGEYSRKMFTHTVVSKVERDGEKISTTRIRELILNGDTEHAARYIGRPYEMQGVVVHGDKRGRTLGFPTANLQFKDPYVHPAKGIYAVKMKVDNTWYNGLANVGTRPTFYTDGKSITIEVYLLDFNQDIYDKEVAVNWFKRLRPEEKFDNVDDLIKQMKQDEVDARAYFSPEEETV